LRIYAAHVSLALAPKARWSPKYRTHINLSRNRGGAEFSGARSTFTSSSGCSLVAPSSWRNSSATFAPSIATRPAYAPNPQLGAARMSKPWNARLWLSSTCAVPRQFDEALAKSSAKQINFSRNAGSLISRNAFIKRTPSLGSAASDSRNLLMCSSRLLFIVLGFILYNQSV
jgi:hypothetical protein